MCKKDTAILWTLSHILEKQRFFNLAFQSLTNPGRWHSPTKMSWKTIVLHLVWTPRDLDHFVKANGDPKKERTNNFLFKKFLFLFLSIHLFSIPALLHVLFSVTSNLPKHSKAMKMWLDVLHSSFTWGYDSLPSQREQSRDVFHQKTTVTDLAVLILILILSHWAADNRTTSSTDIYMRNSYQGINVSALPKFSFVPFSVVWWSLHSYQILFPLGLFKCFNHLAAFWMIYFDFFSSLLTIFIALSITAGGVKVTAEVG